MSKVELEIAYKDLSQGKDLPHKDIHVNFFGDEKSVQLGSPELNNKMAGLCIAGLKSLRLLGIAENIKGMQDDQKLRITIDYITPEKFMQILIERGIPENIAVQMFQDLPKSSNTVIAPVSTPIDQNNQLIGFLLRNVGPNDPYPLYLCLTQYAG